MMHAAMKQCYRNHAITLGPEIIFAKCVRSACNYMYNAIHSCVAVLQGLETHSPKKLRHKLFIILFGCSLFVCFNSSLATFTAPPPPPSNLSVLSIDPMTNETGHWFDVTLGWQPPSNALYPHRYYDTEVQLQCNGVPTVLKMVN